MEDQCQKSPCSEQRSENKLIYLSIYLIMFIYVQYVFYVRNKFNSSFQDGLSEENNVKNISAHRTLPFILKPLVLFLG